MNSYPTQAINKLIPSKNDLYFVLSDSPDFALKLPSLTSKAVTISYLLNVSNGAVFSIKKASYREYNRKSYLNKIDYFAELGKLIENLGFDIDTLPDKAWLKNALFSIKPDHEFFKNQPVNLIQINER